MLFLKFSQLFLISAFMINFAYAGPKRFTTQQCLDAHYDSYIKYEGQFFGLITNELWIKKSQCIIEVKFKKILERKWLVDICREPVHMKYSAKGSQDVHKRSGYCSKKDKSDYCVVRNDLVEILQDYGLIYADGEREELNTSHGQTYCAFVMLKKYLDDGHVFSKYDRPMSLFGYEEPTPVAKPIAKPVESTAPKVDPELTKQVNNLESPLSSTIPDLTAPETTAPESVKSTDVMEVPDSVNNEDSEPRF